MTDLAGRPTAVAMRERGQTMVPGEPLSLAMRRMSLDILDRAVDQLRPSGDGPIDDRIHGARKKLKRLRGLIRLVRDEVGSFSYRQENVVLRDTARALAPVRDALVKVQTLRSLRGYYRDLLDQRTFATTEEWLVDRHRIERTSVTDQVLVDGIVNLASARSRFARFSVEHAIADDFGAIARGLKRVYRRGHRGFRRSADTRSVEDLHEWRKRVKYLRYQLEALTPLQPRLYGSFTEELDLLGDLLGDDHDMAVLAQAVAHHPGSVRDERERWLLVALAHDRRQELQQRALRAGSALYAEPPKAFLSRMEAYWKSGRRA